MNCAQFVKQRKVERRDFMEGKAVIEVRNAKKVYRMGQEKIKAVDGVSFTVNEGEFCCLLGTSGSGKSTLLNLMAGIEKLTSGEILIKGASIGKMSENKLAKFRQENLGFVFQSYNLIGSMTALENVEFPLVFKRVPASKRRKLAKQMLRDVGLKGRMNHKPKEMSGGQQQRVGIARAFVAKPSIVFADEPTGNLDSRTTTEVMNLIKSMARKNKQTLVMVTHDRSLTAYADKIINVLDGHIQSVEIIENSYEPPSEAELAAAAKNVEAEAAGKPASDEAAETAGEVSAEMTGAAETVTGAAAESITGAGETVTEAADSVKNVESVAEADAGNKPEQTVPPGKGKSDDGSHRTMTELAEQSWEKANKKMEKDIKK